ncbi:Hypothetical protein CLAU_2602 [Clostridium autoethanogenum DSM 10061]|nr:Hypothetical protein CLAU_2602 [Clostridium autoethanogenum DSM 10061]OVY48726.1 hypothetical protein WX72_00366 [Clostridium autoethanogenum]
MYHLDMMQIIINESYLVGVLFLPLSLDELSRGVATVSSHFDRSGSVTVGSHQIKNRLAHWLLFL